MTYFNVIVSAGRYKQKNKNRAENSLPASIFAFGLRNEYLAQSNHIKHLLLY